MTVRRCVRVTVEARGSHSTQVTLYVFMAPPATHGLDSGPGSRDVPGPRRGGPTPVRPAPARAEEVEVVAPAAPSAPPLESDGYPRRKQLVHPNIVQFYVFGERFQLYSSIVWSFMHMATIGFFGKYFVSSVLYAIETTLRNDNYITGHKKNGDKNYLISTSMIEDV